jgi:serine/threonine protein kinase
MVEDPHPQLPSDVSPELTDFLKQCFTRNARERPSCAQLLEVSSCEFHFVFLKGGFSFLFQHPWIAGLRPEGDSSEDEEEKRHRFALGVLLVFLLVVDFFVAALAAWAV